MSHYLMDVLPPVCHNIAIWLTVLLAAQRYIYVQHPTMAPDWCTLKIVKTTSFGILVVSLLPMLPKFYEVTFQMYTTYRVAYFLPANGNFATFLQFLHDQEIGCTTLEHRK